MDAASELPREATDAGGSRDPAGSRGGRALEWLLVGGLTPLLFPIAWLLRRQMGRDASEAGVDWFAFHLSFVINNPHFAVTYLLFYRGVRERAFGGALPRWQRLRYLWAGFVAPAGLAAWAGWALSTGSARVMGALIQLMFALVGWHYVKQGFGILAVFSARRGYVFEPLERRALLAHCFAAWAYAWASPAEPAREIEEKGVLHMAVARPAWLEHLTLIVVVASALAVIGILLRGWLKARRRPPAGPFAAFLVSVWLWTVWASLDPLVMYLVPALHSIQYLYVVWLLRRSEARAEEGPPLFGKPPALRVGALFVGAVALGWLLFRGAPSFLDASVLGATAGDRATGLGATPYLAAFYVFVNIHHYFMDNVIWRRENPETRHLRAA